MSTNSMMYRELTDVAQRQVDALLTSVLTNRNTHLRGIDVRLLSMLCAYHTQLAKLEKQVVGEGIGTQQLEALYQQVVVVPLLEQMKRKSDEDVTRASPQSVQSVSTVSRQNDTTTNVSEDRVQTGSSVNTALENKAHAPTRKEGNRRVRIDPKKGKQKKRRAA